MKTVDTNLILFENKMDTVKLCIKWGDDRHKNTKGVFGFFIRDYKRIVWIKQQEMKM